jgi:hypothetical protein
MAERAYHLMELDAGRGRNFHFAALRQLVISPPENLLLRWMLAVQCRSYDLNEEGGKHYESILAEVAVGSSLSFSNNDRFRSIPHRYPPSSPLLRTTR